MTMFSLCMHISNPVKPCGQRCWHLKPKHSNPSPSPSPFPAAVKSLIDNPCQICSWLVLHQHIESSFHKRQGFMSYWQHIRKHLEGAILIPADDKRLNGVTRKTSGRSSWLMVMDVSMCGCQHLAYLVFVLNALTRFIEKRVKKFDGWSYTTPIK